MKMTLWKYVPYVSTILAIVGVAATIIVAKINCKVQLWDVPFVSVAGRSWPESTIFGFFIATSQVFGFLTASMAWKYFNIRNPSKMNNAAIIVYTIASICTLLDVTSPIDVFEIVALENQIIHNSAGAATFINGCIYSVLIAIIGATECACRKPCHKKCLKCVFKITNASCAVVTALVFGFGYTAKSVKQEKYGEQRLFNETGTEWMNEDGSCKDIIHLVPMPIRSYQTVAGVALIIMIFNIAATTALCSSYFNEVWEKRKDTNGVVLEELTSFTNGKHFQESV